jgi:hypothetical protein
MSHSESLEAIPSPLETHASGDIPSPVPTAQKPPNVSLRFRLLSLDAKTCDKRAIKGVAT